MPAGDLTQGYIFVPAEKSIDQVKMNAIVGQAYINPAFISAQTESTSSTTGDYFLLLKSGGTLAKIVLDNLANSLAATTGFQSQIWSTRLRSFNAAGNCSFSVDQKTVGTGISSLGAAGFIQDRWQGYNGLATGRASAVPTYGNIALPGTSSFYITDRFLRVTLTTVQASLAAGELIQIFQTVEGPMLRELLGDVHSISLLVRSSVAGLKFGCALRDASSVRSLCKLCTIPSANVWTLIALPNLPIWDAGATWSVLPGNQGYNLSVTLAAGTTYTAAAADTWQAGNFLAPPGMSNFAASTVNSTFDIAFIQHEPGSATTLQDKPFSQNLDECLRYYYKTYRYAIRSGNASDQVGAPMTRATKTADTQLYGWFPFSKVMAKTPMIIGYSTVSGTSGTVRDITNNADRVIGTTGWGVGESGFEGFAINGPAGSGLPDYAFHFSADTGW
jgi:hypothetical protein